MRVKTYGNGHFRRSPGGAWIYAATGQEVPGAIEVPIRGRRVMWAPELHPEALLPVARAAELCGIKAASFRRMLARGQVPPPVFHIGFCPVWTRGVLEGFKRTRPSVSDPGSHLARRRRARARKQKGALPPSG